MSSPDGGMRGGAGALRRRSRPAAAVVALMVAGTVLPAAAYPRPGRTELVSLAWDGTQGIRGSDAPSISADGRFVAFISFAENLVPGGPVPDPNYQLDVFVRDRQAGTTERVPEGTDGAKGNNVSDSPSISADGRFVAFRSYASNLIPGDTNGTWDVFVRDRVTGATERVSVGPGGAQASGASLAPAISADGRFVAFWSDASNLVPGDGNGVEDILVRDRVAGVTERASISSAGVQGNGYSLGPSISADGRYVAFLSAASNLVPGDTNTTEDVFVRDRQAGTTERVSVGPGGTQGNGSSSEPSISADGSVVAFKSFASNLVPSDTNDGLPSPPSCGCDLFSAETFVHDRGMGATERVSVASSGAEIQGYSWAAPSVSADGRFVAFNFTPPSHEGETFVRDRETGTTELVSVHPPGWTGGPNSTPSMSGDGRYVAFHSRATNLVVGDTNGREDVFVRDLGRPVGVGDASAILDGDAVSVTGWATFSGQVLASAEDPSSDGAPGAAEAGAELTGASLTYRPEQEDVLVRLRVASLPGERCTLDVCEEGGGAPGVVAPGLLHRRLLYGMGFELAGTPYKVRARTGSTFRSPAGTESDPPHYALFRCDPDCTEQAPLSGGIGTVGVEVRLSVPLSTLGDSEGAVLTRVRAFTVREEGALEAQETIDEVLLADATIPAPRVSLGIAAAGTPEEGVSFSTQAVVAEGTFSGTVEASSIPAGEYDVWARACLGQVCGAASTPITAG